MAVVEDRRERCEGCGRSMSLEALTTITMPDGDRLACCPQCEPHARTAAEKLSALEPERGRCDGCTEEFLASDLEDVVLTDGTVITCCEKCRTEAVPFGSGAATRSGTETTSGDAPDAETGTGRGARTTEIATRRNLCSQCHEWADAELFHVTTIDGRTEEMCSTCKEVAEETGVVTDVKMRKSEAREILNVEPGASARTIRRAFLQQIKHAHPDRKSGSRAAFKLVKEAYDRLH